MLNKVILQGRLTQTPELKTTNNGQSVSTFSLAVERDYSTNGERETDFINIVTWNKTAEHVTKYFTKGKQMLVVGSLQVRKYQTQNGENRHATEVTATNVYFCGDKEKTSQGENYAYSNADTGDFTEVDNNEDLPF